MNSLWIFQSCRKYSNPLTNSLGTENSYRPSETKSHGIKSLLWFSYLTNKTGRGKPVCNSKGQQCLFSPLYPSPSLWLGAKIDRPNRPIYSIQVNCKRKQTLFAIRNRKWKQEKRLLNIRWFLSFNYCYWR